MSIIKKKVKIDKNQHQTVDASPGHLVTPHPTGWSAAAFRKVSVVKLLAQVKWSTSLFHAVMKRISIRSDLSDQGFRFSYLI